MNYADMINNYEIVFDAKPDAVPYNYRISYKVSQICLIIDMTGWGNNGCSPIKLHMISFALSSKEIMDKLIAFTQGDSEAPMIRFDPAVNKAVSFAIADGLIVQTNKGRYALSEKGKMFVTTIKKDKGVLVAEKIELQGLSKKLSEERINRLAEIWRSKYADN